MNAWRRFAEALDLEIDRGAAARTFANHAGTIELFKKSGCLGRAVFERPAGKLADMGIFSKLFGTAKGADAPIKTSQYGLAMPALDILPSVPFTKPSSPSAGRVRDSSMTKRTCPRLFARVAEGV